MRLPQPFPPAVIAAIRYQAQAEWPREACGVVTPDGYVPLRNVDPDPENAFDCTEEVQPYIIAGTIRALVHSHPHPAEGNAKVRDWPSSADMRSQMAMNVPWGILVSAKDGTSEPWFWGPGMPIPPLVGRQFRHGPSGTDGKGDCYALVKDWFAQEHGIELLDLPREWNWWAHPELKPDTDIYDAHFEEAGFRTISASEVRRGDCAMITIPTQPIEGNGPALTRTNHAAVYIGGEKVLHHKWGRLSVEEMLGTWNRLVVRWVRHADFF